MNSYNSYFSHAMSFSSKVIGNDTEWGAILNRDFLGKRSHYIEVGSEKIVLPGKYEHFLSRIQNFEVRDDDVYVLAFQKSGSRWAHEMIWLLQHGLDFDTARTDMLCKRAPLLDLEPMFDEPQSEYCYLHLAEKKPSPRSIRTHLPWSLLPKQITSGAKEPKIIVIMRNPEDTCTSYYYQSSVVDGYSGTWDDFCRLFLEGKVPYGPYWNCLLSYWEQRSRPNVLIVNYNQMKEDLEKTVADVAKFLGKSLTGDDLKKMCNYLQFDNLKNMPGFNMQQVVGGQQEVNPFIRVGKIGDHKNKMSAEVCEAFKRQKDKYMKETGLNLI